VKTPPWADIQRDWDAGDSDKTLSERYDVSPRVIEERRRRDKLAGTPWTPHLGGMPRKSEPARLSPTATVVPSSAIGLPWATYPRDPGTAKAVAALLEHASKDAAVVALGNEATGFFVSHASLLREMAKRSEAEKPPEVDRPLRQRHRLRV
jgi:hypothetical protein